MNQAPSTPQRKLAAIVFTDIAGFTAMSAHDEEKALQLLNQQRLILKPLVIRYGGDWLKEIGDGLLLSFPSSKQALRCAIEIQKQTNDIDDLNLRIGIHQGDILEQDGDIFGDDVNIASRIEPFAAVGGIAVSHKIMGDISGSPEFQVKYIGQPNLKGVQQEVKVYCITSHDLPETKHPSVSAKLEKPKHSSFLWLITATIILGTVGIILYFLRPELGISTEPRLGPKSVAVLPFANWSDLPENEYFSDGITDDILTQLTKIADLKVISRTSIMQYKNTKKSIREISEELGVASILEGSVRRQGNSVRITGQLIDTSTDEHLWADNFDRNLEDIFAIQSEVAKSIASALEAVLTPEEIAQVDQVPTKSMEAYDHYQRSNQLWLQYGREGRQNPELVRESLSQLEQAVVLDSGFAEAYAAMLNRQIYLGLHTDRDLQERLKEGEEALFVAMEIDSNNAAVIKARGFYEYRWHNNWERAFEMYKKALVMTPGDSEIMETMGYMNRWIGQFDESIELLERAMELDPANLALHWELLSIYIFSRHYEKAQDLAEHLVAVYPENRQVQYYRLLLYLNLGDLQKVRKIFAEMNDSFDERDFVYYRYEEALYNREYERAKSILEVASSKDVLAMADVLKLLDQQDLSLMFYDSAKSVNREVWRYDKLSRAFAGLDQADSALHYGEIARKTFPIKSRPYQGERVLTDLGFAYISLEMHDEALDILDTLLANPGNVTIERLRLDPRVDPLRDLPRFKSLMEAHNPD